MMPTAPEQASGEQFSRGYDGTMFPGSGRIDERNIDDLLAWAGARKASDLTIQTGWTVRAEIGGRIVPVTEHRLTEPELNSIVCYLQNSPSAIAELNGGKRLNLAHEVTMGSLPDGSPDRMRYRVNAKAIRVPGGRGIAVTIRTLPRSIVPLSAYQPPIPDAILENFRPANGMVWVTGPTGSGKSTLLSSLVAMILGDPDRSEKYVEAAAPIEYVYDGLECPSSVWNQWEVPRDVPTFAEAIENNMREKPTIIAIGETRDPETMAAGLVAAQTGHVYLTTMHTVGVADSTSRAVRLFPPDQQHLAAYDIMHMLRMVVTQILIPRRGGGKVACREYMVFNEELRHKLTSIPAERWPSAIRETFRAGAVPCQTMAACALELFEADLIDEPELRKLQAKARIEEAADT